MNHEVYICYDDKDQITSNDICHVLEENKIKCWFKTRDLGVTHMVDGIMEAIKEAQVMVLIFSSHAKESNFVNTEVDIAFTENIPILVFKIDESKLDGGLEFFLNNKHWLDAYPDPEVKFDSLIRDTSKLLEKPISKPVVSNKTSVYADESEAKDEKVEKPKKPKRPKREKSPVSGGGSSKSKVPILIGIALVVVIAVVAGYFLMNNQGEMEQTTLVLSESAYMKVPENGNASAKVDKNGIFHYIDEKNSINVTSYNANQSLEVGASKMDALEDAVKTGANEIQEDNGTVYEKDGIYSVIVENNDYEDSLIIQSTNKDLLMQAWNSIKFHDPTDSFKPGESSSDSNDTSSSSDSGSVVSAVEQTQSVVKKYSSSSSSSSGSSSSSSSSSSSLFS